MGDKNKIFGYVCMGCGLLILLSVFLSYVSVYGISKSIWSLKSATRIIFILCGLGVFALYFFNKKTELSYLFAGHILLSVLESIINNEGLDYFAIAFYLLFLASCAIVVCTFLYDESNGTSLLDLLTSRSNNNYNQSMGYNSNNNYNQNMNYNSNNSFNQNNNYNQNNGFNSNNNFNQNNGFNTNNNFNQNNSFNQDNNFNSNNNFNQMNQSMMNNQNSNMFIPNDNSSNNNFN